MRTKHIQLAIAFLLTLVIGFVPPSKAQKPSDIKEVTIWAAMSCENCKKKIERDIAFEKGVKSIVVDLPSKTVTIKYKRNKNSDENLVKAIEKLGYKAKLVEPNTKAKGNEKKE